MNKKALFGNYLKNLSDTALRGDAREESFYPVLAEMLKEVGQAQASQRSHIHIATLPKATDAGNPDFRLWNGTNRIVGYIRIYCRIVTPLNYTLSTQQEIDALYSLVESATIPLSDVAQKNHEI